jgi:DNA-binding MarR family transcriptional regulator
MEAFFQAYRAFTRKPDETLAGLGLARVHHRILFFVASRPGLSVKELLAALGVSKQAINLPLRQLIEMELVDPQPDLSDKRIKRLTLTQEGSRLESTLHAQQLGLLEQVFSKTGGAAVEGWLTVNRALQQGGQEGLRTEEKTPSAEGL